MTEEQLGALLPGKSGLVLSKLSNRCIIYGVDGGNPLFFDPDGRGGLLPTVRACMACARSAACRVLRHRPLPPAQPAPRALLFPPLTSLSLAVPPGHPASVPRRCTPWRCCRSCCPRFTLGARCRQRWGRRRGGGKPAASARYAVTLPRCAVRGAVGSRTPSPDAAACDGPPQVLGGADLFLQGVLAPQGGLPDFLAGSARSLSVPGNPVPFAGELEGGAA